MQAHYSANLISAQQYLRALEAFATGDALATFFTADVLQDEFPNRLVPTGARRTLADLMQAGERGKQILSAQRYELLHAIEEGDKVALEVQWTGTLAVPFETIPAGGDMRARFAVFLEFQDGKIRRQRNYDCFEPW